MKWEPAVGSGFLLNYNFTISPTMVFTAGIGWIGEINDQYNKTTYSFPGVQDGIIPTNILFDGQHAPTNWGTSGAWLQSINRKLGIAIVDNLLWTKGRNTFNIGTEIRRSYQDDNEEQTEGGQFHFSHNETADPNNLASTGSAFASYLLGIPDSANRSNSQELKLRNFDFSPYIQDDIKFTPKLTINVGLRWDMMVPFTEEHNNIVFFDPSIPNPAADGLAGAVTKFGNCTGCAGYDRAPINWHHFGPRLGFAYQINNKTVVQGGYSIAFLDGGAYEYGTNKVAVNYGNLLQGAFSQNSTGTNRIVLRELGHPHHAQPAANPLQSGPWRGRTAGGCLQQEPITTHRTARCGIVNLQRQLPGQMFATVAYVGTKDIHLPSQLNSDQPAQSQVLRAWERSRPELRCRLRNQRFCRLRDGCRLHGSVRRLPESVGRIGYTSRRPWFRIRSTAISSTTLKEAAPPTTTPCSSRWRSGSPRGLPS